jgi:hypothetical protein
MEKRQPTRAYKERQKKLIVKALTDPKFRVLLEKAPEKALNIEKLSVETAKEIRIILAAVKGISAQISGLADELLCANGGGCGIA